MATKEAKRERKIVLASGVFDLLHPGHVKYLEEAKKAGGADAELVVIIARDSTVLKHKGKKPVIPENQRRTLVESLKVVDEAILGYEDFSIEKAIEKLRPDVIAFGYDQETMEKKVRQHLLKKALNIAVFRISKFGEDELDSSLKIKQKIIEHYRR